jgi:type VI secretion system protein ImpH
MASTNRPAERNLNWLQGVAAAPYRYSLFGVLRRLEHGRAGARRFGESVRPGEEPLRLGQAPSMAFAPAEIAAFVAATEGRPARLELHGLGLLGPHGALPLHLTEYVRNRLQNMADPTFSRFLDMFHHRMMSLLYRAWANAEPTASYDRGEDDRFAVYVGSLFGIGFPSLRKRDAWPDAAKLHHAGRLVVQTRCPGPLRQMLTDYFEVPTRVEEFIGEWLQVPSRQCWRLGESPGTGTLGVSATAGDEVWSRSHRFRVIVGPLRLEEFRAFLPPGETLARLVALVRNYIGDELQWDLNLILKKDEVPPFRLGEEGELGMTSWLTTDSRTSDATDAVIDPSDASRASEHEGHAAVPGAH